MFLTKLFVFVLGLHYGSAVAFSPTSPMRNVGAHPATYLPSTSPPVFSHPGPQVHQNIVVRAYMMQEI